MDRAEFLRRAGVGAAGMALAAAAPGQRGARAQASKPNILLIMTDDQPHHTIKIMESLQNRLVAAGMRFDNGYVATPVCGPARGSVLTGKWSHNTGLENTEGAWRDLVDSGELARNVARRLKAVGYACHLSRLPNCNRLHHRLNRPSRARGGLRRRVRQRSETGADRLRMEV